MTKYNAKGCHASGQGKSRMYHVHDNVRDLMRETQSTLFQRVIVQT